jgi:hypothetical protein
VAQAGLDLLLAQVSDGIATPGRVVIEPDLVVRDSVAGRNSPVTAMLLQAR